MITKLTKEQIDQIPHYVKKWEKIITNTDETDRPKAEEAVREICEVLGYDMPEMTWCDGPKMYDKIVCIGPEYLNLKLYDEILVKCLDEKIHPDIRIQIKVLMWKTKVGYSKILEDIENIFTIRDCDDYLSSVFPMSWVVPYDFCISCLGLKDTPGLLKPLTQVYESCFSINFYENTCVLCEQPTVFSINDKGQLHSENGPALVFKDGFEVYAIDGEIQSTGLSK